jgi:hypothetical protein
MKKYINLKELYERSSYLLKEYKSEMGDMCRILKDYEKCLMEKYPNLNFVEIDECVSLYFETFIEALDNIERYCKNKRANQ